MDSNSTYFIPNPQQQQLPKLVFVWSDYLLFGGLLGVSLFIGLFFGFFRKQNSANEYLFGGKHMQYFPVAISVLASTMSGIGLLGIPTEVYLHGGQYFLNIISTILVVVIMTYVFIPVYYKLQLSSVYEYLELRFSSHLRNFASIMFIIVLMMYIPMVVYIPSIAFSQLTGFSYYVIAPILSIVCITYTTMGGVKAVIWTDAIQFIFMIGGVLTVLILGLVKVGGLSEVLKVSTAGHRLDILDFNPSPLSRNSFWGFFIGMTFSSLGITATSQKIIQRCMSIEKESDIRKSLVCQGVGSIILTTICVLMGLVIYTKYHDCDPITAKLVERSDQIVPYYVMDVAGHIPGIPGLFLAGIVSTALSTMSASLNTLAGCIYEDFIDARIAEGPNKDAKATNIMKGLSLLIGLITIGLVFVIEHLGTIIEISFILRGVVEGPLFGLFLLGLFVPFVGKTGATTGAWSSLFVMAWIVFGAKWHILQKHLYYPVLPVSMDGCPGEPGNYSSVFVTSNSSEMIVDGENEPFILFQISFMYYVFCGTMITFVVACGVSLAMKEWKTIDVNPDLFTPMVHGILPKRRYTEVPLAKVILRESDVKSIDT